METLNVNSEQDAVPGPLVATCDENSELLCESLHSTLKMAAGGQVSPSETEVSQSANVLLAVKLLESLSKSAESQADASVTGLEEQNRKICGCAMQVVRDHAEYCEQQVGRSGDDCAKREAELFLERYKSLSLSQQVFHKLPNCANCGESASENNQCNTEEFTSQPPTNTSLHVSPAEGHHAADAVNQSSELHSEANGESGEQPCPLKEQKQTQLRSVEFGDTNGSAMLVQQEASLCEVASFLSPKLEECSGTQLTHPRQNYDRAQVFLPMCAHMVIDYCSSKKSGEGWKCDMCLTGAQATEPWRCSSCGRDLCTECDSKLHRKSRFANHTRVKLHVIFTRPDLLDPRLHQQVFELAGSNLTTKELATVFVIYAKQWNTKRFSLEFFKSALDWYSCKLIDLQEKVAQAVFQLRGSQFSLPVETIGSVLLAMHGNESRTIRRCADLCIDSITEVRKLYDSLTYPQIGYFVSEFDFSTSWQCKELFHRKVNETVVEEFLFKTADLDLAKFVALLRTSTFSDEAQVIRCLIAHKFEPSTVPKLLSILSSKEDAKWRIAALQIALDDPSAVSSHPIERLLTLCNRCKSWSPQRTMGLMPCDCSLCSTCMQQTFQQAVQLERIERMSCPACRHPAIDSDSDLRSFRKYADFLICEILPKLNETLRIALTDRFEEYESRVQTLVQCEICTELVEPDQTYSMFLCTCKICITCAVKYYELAIAEKSVVDWGCCICKKPTDPDTDQKQFEQHIWFLCESLRTKLSIEAYDKLNRKVAEWNIRKDERFRWCKCGNGFVWSEPNERRTRMECPQCKRRTCFKCGKDWEIQHDGISCEQFDQWKIANDPEYQAQGLKAYLEQVGITCPNPGCKFKYALARGGCMHFTCSSCNWEFCGCCGARYFHGSQCSKQADCAKRGLHAHCVADCFSNLRDCSVKSLQDLLNSHGVQYGMRSANQQAGARANVCEVVEQKDDGSDQRCGRPLCAAANHAQLCEMHYKEYLVEFIRKNKLDVAPLFA